MSRSASEFAGMKFWVWFDIIIPEYIYLVYIVLALIAMPIGWFIAPYLPR